MDEIGLDPSVSWLQMGTRALGDLPWLLVDEKQTAELSLRGELLDRRRDDVLATPADALEPAEELLAMIREAGVEIVGDEHDHPLDRLGRSVQEDLCLLRREPQEWYLGGAVLCFPSRWRLTEKIGRPLREVHGPTPGYDPKLADRVTSLLDRLGDKIVRRRNWFIHPDGSLHQPDRAPVEAVVPAANCGTDLFVRSERQTLRSLPETGWIVFTIRIQHDTIDAFVADDDRAKRLVDYLDQAPPGDLDHRGLSAAQAEELRAFLA